MTYGDQMRALAVKMRCAQVAADLFVAISELRSLSPGDADRVLADLGRQIRERTKLTEE